MSRSSEKRPSSELEPAKESHCSLSDAQSVHKINETKKIRRAAKRSNSGSSVSIEKSENIVETIEETQIIFKPDMPHFGIGYPCINWTNQWTTGHTFRLANYTEDRLIQTVSLNLDHLEKMLQWNVPRGFKFLRIGSGVVPFASHPKVVGSFDWATHFKERLLSIGNFIKKHQLRISMHPDQFVLINSPKPDVSLTFVAELDYHCRLLDAMGLDSTAKVQLHVGGVYGDKEAAIGRFIAEYQMLPASIKRRLVIENDDRLYSLKDCLRISQATGVPVLFDNLHHECLNNGEPLREAVLAAFATWKPHVDGRPMMDYSSQQPGARVGRHCDTLDLKHFAAYCKELSGLEADVMLEVKDKEVSAAKALEYLTGRQISLK